jgi:flagellar motor switch protein FliN/FliY
MRGVSLQDELRGNGDVPLAFAGALERALGSDTALTIGLPHAAVIEVLPDEDRRAVCCDFTTDDGATGTIAAVISAQFAQTLERAASDELLVTSLGPALDAVSDALAALAAVGIEAGGPAEVDLAGLDDRLGEHDVVVIPILEGSDAVACLAITTSPGTGAGGAQPGVTAPGALPVPESGFVLADVEMGVTAELGRCEMTVRELLSLTPGAVIDLDRPAGALVDLLVNGKLIARGEVVVIDEEFGIRVSEIVGTGSPTR